MTEIVLYVDDERSNRIVMKHAMAKTFNLMLASSGEEALEIIENTPIAVLLTDQRMPHMSGVDLAERVHAKYPEIERVIVTAYSDLQATVDSINRGRVSRFIKKPWTPEEVMVVVNDSINTYRLRAMNKEIQMRLMKFDRITNMGIAALGVAHDLKQPLQIVVPSIESAEMAVARIKSEPNLPASLLPLIDVLEESHADIVEGVNMLRDLASTVMRLADNSNDQQVFDIRDAVHNCLTVIRSTVHRTARLDVKLPNGPAYVRGSTTRVVQLLVNLLINASQSFEKGESTLNNQVKLEISADADNIFVVVTDNGRGIPEDIQRLVFNPLFTTKREAGGSGIGLAICRQVVSELNGDITLKSIVGEGTEFGVRLPRENHL